MNTQTKVQSVLVGDCDRCDKIVPVYSTSRYLGRCSICHRSGIVKVLNKNLNKK